MIWFDIVLALVAAGLALALTRQLIERRKLRRWLSQSRPSDPPEAGGAWGEVFNVLHRHRRENLRRRRQLARLMVRSRRVAQALPYGVTVLDAQMRVDWCNEAAHEHLGLDPERDRGEAVVNFVRQPEFVAYLAAREFAQPLRLRTPAAGTRTISIQFVPFETWGSTRSATAARRW